MQQSPPKKSWTGNCLFNCIKLYIGIVIIGFAVVTVQHFYKMHEEHEAHKLENKQRQRREKNLSERFGKGLSTQLYIVNGDNATATIKIIGEDHIRFAAQALPMKTGKAGRTASKSLVIIPEDDLLLTIFSRERSGSVHLEVVGSDSTRHYLCPVGGTHLFKLTYHPRLEWETLKYSQNGTSPFPRLGLAKAKKTTRSPGIYRMADKIRRVYAYDEEPPRKIKTSHIIGDLPVSGGIKIKKFKN